MRTLPEITFDLNKVEDRMIYVVHQIETGGEGTLRAGDLYEAVKEHLKLREELTKTRDSMIEREVRAHRGDRFHLEVYFKEYGKWYLEADDGILGNILIYDREFREKYPDIPTRVSDYGPYSEEQLRYDETWEDWKEGIARISRATTSRWME